MEEGLAFARDLADPEAEASFLSQLANLDRAQGDPEAALGCLISCVAVCQQTDNRPGEARAFAEISSILAETGRLAEARRVLTVSHLLFAALGRPEADEFYGRLVKLTGDLQQPAESILGLLQPASDAYQKDRGAALLQSVLVTRVVKASSNGSPNGPYPGLLEIAAPTPAAKRPDITPGTPEEQVIRPTDPPRALLGSLRTTRPPTFPLSESNPGAGLYLDLVKRSVTNMIYGSETERHFDARRRAEGHDWPPPEYAKTMIGLRRLDNLQHCLESVLSDGVLGDVFGAGVWRGGAGIPAYNSII